LYSLQLTGREWQQLLEEYREEHPEVTVLDPPGAIEHLLNRQSMLQEVSELDLSDCHGNFYKWLLGSGLEENNMLYKTK
jgi:hypothetical protein